MGNDGGTGIGRRRGIRYLLFFYLWRQRKRDAYDGRLFLPPPYTPPSGGWWCLSATTRRVGPFSVAHLARLVLIVAAGLAGAVLKRRSGPETSSGTQPKATASGIGGIAGKLEDSLLWQLVLLILAIALSLLVFYGFKM